MIIVVSAIPSSLTPNTQNHYTLIYKALRPNPLKLYPEDMLRGLFLFLILALGSSAFAGETNLVDGNHLYNYKLFVGLPKYDMNFLLDCMDYFYFPQFSEEAMPKIKGLGITVALACIIQNRSDKALFIPMALLRYSVNGNNSFVMVAMQYTEDGYYISPYGEYEVVLTLPLASRSDNITIDFQYLEDGVVKTADSTPLPLAPIPIP